MSERDNTGQEAIEAVRELPRAITPARDLWPSIEVRLARRTNQAGRDDTSRGWGRPALAASVAVAFVAGLMFGRQVGIDGPEAGKPVGPDPSMQAVLQASELEYLAAFREFIPVGSTTTLLKSEALQNIENSWAELRQAETALLAAIEKYPDNVYLNRKLLDLRAQQLDFMRQLATLDQISRRKI